MPDLCSRLHIPPSAKAVKIDTVPLCVWTFGNMALKYDPRRMHFDIKFIIGNSMSISSMYQRFYSDFVSCKD